MNLITFCDNESLLSKKDKKILKERIIFLSVIGALDTTTCSFLKIEKKCLIFLNGVKLMKEKIVTSML